MFRIEDEQHAELQHGEYRTFEEALEELKRRAVLPWDITPNRCPCKSWRTCHRNYEIVEYDERTIPWKENSRKLALTISSEQVEWKLKIPNDQG